MKRDRLGSRIEPVRVVPHTRPLYFQDGTLFCSRFDRLLGTDDYGRTFSEVGRLRLEIPLRPLVASSTLVQRVLRAGVYRMRVLPDGTKVLVFKGGVYVQSPGQGNAVRTYVVERGSRPVSLAVTADGLVVFGEYWRNLERGEVRIFGSRDSGRTWQVVHTLAPGDVRHIHGISYDRWEDCFWICAGDEGAECRLLRASVDFRDVRVVRQGGQENRFYSILVAREHLLTATDSPDDPNHVCIVDKASGALTRVARIENSNFYNCQVGGRYFVSTNAEPTSVNDMTATHVWMGRADGGWRRVLTFPVDLLFRLAQLPGVPSGLFQYTRVFFPEGDNPGEMLVCHCIGASGYSSAMLCFDPSAFETGA